MFQNKNSRLHYADHYTPMSHTFLVISFLSGGAVKIIRLLAVCFTGSIAPYSLFYWVHVIAPFRPNLQLMAFLSFQISAREVCCNLLLVSMVAHHTVENCCQSLLLPLHLIAVMDSAFKLHARNLFQPLATLREKNDFLAGPLKKSPATCIG